MKFNDGAYSCGKPTLYQYPCSHLLAICAHRNVGYEQFISSFYSVQYLVHTYAASFFPMRDRSEWPPCHFPGILIPGDKLVRKNAQGKTKRSKRQSRRLHNDMDVMDSTDRGRSCSICKEKGHTKTTCARRKARGDRGG